MRRDKYVSIPADWMPWVSLGFSLNQPQYVQYQVVAAKDGKHAYVIAHGDLNGDGKVSSLTLALRVDPKDGVLIVSPEIDEKDPEE